MRLNCTTENNAKSEISSRDWQTRYDEGKTGWDRGQCNPMLELWLNSAKLKPGKILVPGCGRGHEVIELAARGFEVTAVDFADAAVQSLTVQLQAKGLVANVVQADIFSLCLANDFDAIYEQTFLCAVHPNQWPDYVRRLGTWLRPGGQVFALFMQSNESGGPPFHCDLNAMRQLFDESKWQWSDSTERVEHPTGLHELACVVTRI